MQVAELAVLHGDAQFSQAFVSAEKLDEQTLILPQLVSIRKRRNRVNGRTVQELGAIPEDARISQLFRLSNIYRVSEAVWIEKDHFHSSYNTFLSSACTFFLAIRSQTRRLHLSLRIPGGLLPQDVELRVSNRLWEVCTRGSPKPSLRC